MREKIVKKCIVCSKKFKTKYSFALQCGSEKCKKEKRRLDNLKRRRPAKEMTCKRKGCENKWTRIGEKNNGRKYCSDKCRLHVYFDKPNVDGELTDKKVCKNCGKIFTKSKPNVDGNLRGVNSKHCSSKCRVEYASNLNNQKTKDLDDMYVKCCIQADFKHDGHRIKTSEISSRMIEEKRLLLKLKRVWKEVTDAKL